MPTYAYEPDYAVHPGETLKEMLEEHDMSQAEAARRTGLTKKLICQVASGQTPITVETAIKLENAFGLPADFWLRLQANYLKRLEEIKRRKSRTAETEWLRSVPLKWLVQQGYLEPSLLRADQDQKLDRVLKFFGVRDLKAWKRVWSANRYAFRQKAEVAGNKNRLKVTTWLRVGELKAQKTACQPYSVSAFRSALRAIRETLDADLPVLFDTMHQQCAQAGVAVVLVPKVPGMGVFGVARWLTPRKALIQLSDLYQTDDTLLFAFFHEAGHIRKHSKKQVFLEGLSQGRERDEREADAFARDMLIPPKYEPRLKTLRRRTPLATKRAVRRFAKELQIAPSIVTGRLQHDGIIPYSWCKDLKRKVTLNRAFREAKPEAEGRPKTESG